MSKHDKEIDSTRTAIREAAVSVFKTNGIHASSLQDIAKAVKLSKGTLYYHYPTKEYLILDIADHHLGRMTDLLIGWIDTIDGTLEAGEAVSSLVQLFLRDTSERKLHFLLIGEALLGNNGLKTRFAAKYKEWSVMIEAGAHKLSGDGAVYFRKMSRSFFSVLDGYAMHMLMEEEIDVDFLCKILTKGCIDGND